MNGARIGHLVRMPAFKDGVAEGRHSINHMILVGGAVSDRDEFIHHVAHLLESVSTLTPRGTIATILEESGSWYHVVYRDGDGMRRSGFVRKEYVLMNPTYFTPEGETPVYAMPSGDAKRVGLIDGGTSYPVIGLYDGFLVISLRGASGFVETP